MQLECSNCHQLLNLPDDKLPIGRPFSFNCPYCKEKNTAVIDPPQEAGFSSNPPADNNMGGPMSAPPSDGPSFPPMDQSFIQPPPQFGADQGFQEAPPQEMPPAPAAAPAPLRAPALADEAPPGPTPNFGAGEVAPANEQLTLKQLMSGDIDERPKALVVYDDLETAEKLENKLDALGFQVSVGMNQRDAAKQLKFTNFSLVLIQEDYFGASLNGNHLLKSLQTMDGQARRGMLVVLISPTMTTLDDLLAYSLSLDAIINSSELDNIERILISTIGRSRKFYAIYREVLAAEGLD